MHDALPVAIKVMAPAWLSRKSGWFWREAALLQRCRHPSIVQVLGVYVGSDASDGQEGQPQRHLQQSAAHELQGEDKEPHGVMVVMELLPGGPLHRRLDDPLMRWYCRCVRPVSLLGLVCFDSEAAVHACMHACHRMLSGPPACAAYSAPAAAAAADSAAATCLPCPAFLLCWLQRHTCVPA